MTEDHIEHNRDLSDVSGQRVLDPDALAEIKSDGRRLSDGAPERCDDDR